MAESVIPGQIGIKTAGLVLGVVLALFMHSGLSASDRVTFHTSPVNQQDTDVLYGYVSKPEGPGPFAAVIIAHGCFGTDTNNYSWAKRLNSWGYAVMIVDSFTSREVSTVCESPKKVSPVARAFDIYGAAAYLRKQPFVIPTRIGVIGFSHGGWTALYVAQEYFPERAREPAVQAVVSFYPWCEKSRLKTTGVPLLVLAGQEDKWTPVSRCRKFIKAQKSGYGENIMLKVYDRAYHGFDDSDLVTPVIYDGYTIQYNEVAATESIAETRSFLARYLQ
jgi:dienelactone hydrolase